MRCKRKLLAERLNQGQCLRAIDSKEWQMASGSISYLAVPMFTGENYQIWVVKMKSYLKSIGLWDAVETGRDPPPLRANPTIAQMKQYEEELLKKDKALTVLHSALADHVFTGIMALETAKEVWD